MMKKIFSLSVLALAAAATPAFAADSTVQVTVDAELAKACAFDSGSSETSLTLSNDLRDANGSITYSCNYIGTPLVTLTSANGALAPDEESVELGAVPVPYQIRFGDDAELNSGNIGLAASAFVGGIASDTDTSDGGWTHSTTPNEPVSPNLAIYLTNPIKIAGSYSDTLTCSIAP
jgi:hypothetical protein